MSERSISAATLGLVVLALLGVVFPRQSESLVLKVIPSGDHPDIDADGNPALSTDELARYLNLLSINKRLRNAGFESLDRQWQPTDQAMLLQVLEFIVHSDRQEQLYELLRKKTGRNLPATLDAWYGQLWEARPVVDPRLRSLKRRLYGQFAPEFADYFDDDLPALIAFDEIRFANLLPSHIRVLDEPRWIAPADDAYLADSDLVYAIEFGGEARAYPKKVISRYHVSTDTVGGEPTICVYDAGGETLACFKTSCGGVSHRLTASCFLRRAAPLLCDQATKSLWSIESGEPVVGPLVGKGLQLERIPVATSNWADWREEHPQTKVLADSRPAAEKDDD